MAPRPNWKGYLKLSLVTCSVAMYTATSSSERIRFNLLNRQTGNRLKQQYIDSVTEEVVPSEDKVRGYAVQKNEYVIVEDEELEAVALESTHTINVDKFVERSEVDGLYLDNPYFLAPDDKVGAEAFAVIRDAMEESGKAGIARVVIANRERILLLEPRGKGILATSLRYPYEVRSEESAFTDIPDVDVDTETVRLAKHIIDTKSGEFDPSEFEDRYQEALVELLRAKGRGQPVKPAKGPERPSNVINLMDALRRSLESEGESAPAPKRAARKPAAKSKARPAASRRKPATKTARKKAS